MTNVRRNRGFNFIELMFAIAVLAIGVVGIAGALYVGLDQTRLTQDQTTAAGVARQAYAVLSHAMKTANTPETDSEFIPVFLPEHAGDPAALQSVITGDQISSDRQFAWIPVYRRPIDTNRAEATIIVVRSPASAGFDFADFQSFDSSQTYPPALVPAKATIDIDANTVKISSAAGAERCVPGAALVLTGMSDPALNGRIVRLGELMGDRHWSLEPGQDLADFPNPAGGKALLVGAPYRDRKRPQLGYEGGTQVVALYSMIISVN